MRNSCLNCFRKHVSQALALIIEAQMGYPDHAWLAVGHMAEAEAETILDFPDLANFMREERIKYQSTIDLDQTQAEGKYFPDLMSLIRMATDIAKELKPQDETDKEVIEPIDISSSPQPSEKLNLTTAKKDI